MRPVRKAAPGSPRDRTLSVVNDAQHANYPERATLLGHIGPLLQAARRPVPAGTDLDDVGWTLLMKLADRLAQHQNFEHLGYPGLRDALLEAIRCYKNPPAGRRPDRKEFAAETVDGLAREPMRRTFYLGVNISCCPTRPAPPGHVSFIPRKTRC